MENRDLICKGTDMTEFLKTAMQFGARIQAGEDAPKIIDAYDRKYLFNNNRLELIDVPVPVDECSPECFRPYTLQGLVDWLRADTDKFFTSEKPAALVVVESPTRVTVMSECTGKSKHRIKYAVCQYDAPRIPLNEYVDSESLAVNIHTCFIADDNRDTVLRIVNNLKEEQSEKMSDDGISQRIEIKTGVQEVDSTIFKNPAYLRPMRTFTEVDQPVSPFVVRFKEGRRAAIFEADGGKWKNIAVKSIAEYLKNQLGKLNFVVIG